MSKTFAELGINLTLQQSLSKLKILVPTDIQSKTIPVILTQKEDLVALAKTGTGKTLAFGLPLLQLINTEKSEVQVLILAPTRELSQQIFSNLKLIFTNCGSLVIYPMDSKSLVKTVFKSSQIVVIRETIEFFFDYLE